MSHTTIVYYVFLYAVLIRSPQPALYNDHEHSTRLITLSHTNNVTNNIKYHDNAIKLVAEQKQILKMLYNNTLRLIGESQSQRVN